MGEDLIEVAFLSADLVERGKGPSPVRIEDEVAKLARRVAEQAAARIKCGQAPGRGARRGPSVA